MTIYDNTSAFGLMSEEDQAALQDHFAHDLGEIVYYRDNGQWYRAFTPSWDLDQIYRAVKWEPKPLTVLAPDHMPDWDEVWVAADENGCVWCYPSEPVKFINCWGKEGALRIPDGFRLVDRGTVDWRESLICFKGKK